jgi:monoamine oxidase
MTSFADAMSIERRDGDVLPTVGGFDLPEERRLSQTEVHDLLALQMDGFDEALDSLRERLPAGANAADGIELFLDDRGLTGHARRLAGQALRAVVEADCADDVENQSLRWIGNEVEYDDNLFGDLPIGGYRRVIDALATGLDLRLGAEVAAVEVTDTGVQVRCSDGRTEVASHVVVTVPLGVLKAGAVEFTPALPADRIDAIERLGFGRYEKIVLRFERAFWRDAAITHVMVFHADDVPATWIFDLDAFGDGPALALHVFHGATGRVHDATEHETLGWARQMIGAIVGHACPEPVATIITSWATDPYARGAYTHTPPDAHPDMLDLLARPVHGRILFAGEHTQSARVGYADGALSSGIRAAEQLLGTPTVRLGPTP